MQYGKCVTVTSSGIRMSETELEPIGIHDGTISWGIWFDDWNAPETSREPLVPHFIVCPFHLDYWPVLVRVELRLNWKSGSLARATEVLMNEKLNILSINKTETGHRHSTATIIGEAEDVRISQEFENFSSKFEDLKPVREKLEQHQELRDQINNVLAPMMLRFVERLRKQLFEEHEKNPFLRIHIFINTIIQVLMIHLKIIDLQSYIIHRYCQMTVKKRGRCNV